MVETRCEPRIGAVVARQGREQHAALARDVGDALQAVAPVVEPAQAAHDDERALRDHALDIEVDRHRMAQPLEAGEPQRRQRLRVRLPGGGERREVAVGEGQHDDLGRRLAEIDGDVGLLQGRKLGRQDVHAILARTRSARLDGLPCRSPSRRSPPGGRGAASPAAQRPVELVLDARADALHQQAHRLAGDVDEALHAQDVVRRGGLRRCGRSAPAASRRPAARR